MHIFYSWGMNCSSLTQFGLPDNYHTVGKHRGTLTGYR